MEVTKKDILLDSTIEVNVRREERYFIGICERIGVFTQGKNIEELKKNLREAIDLSLEDSENLEYGLVEHPEIILRVVENVK